MGRKSVSLDEDAHVLLMSRKAPGMTFSDVVRAWVPARRTARDLLRAVRRGVPERATLDSVEKLVRARRLDLAGPARRGR